MPQWNVQAPDGKVIQFPDQFTEADVNREMGKMYGSTSQATGAPAGATDQATSGARTPAPPNMATMSAYSPTLTERVGSAFPFIGRLEEGLRSAFGAPRSEQEALAKPSPAMSTEQAIAPEQAMTPSEQQRHPIATGAGQFLGGMTTPENLLMTAGTFGPAPAAITRPVAGYFSTQMLRGAYQEYGPFKQAVDRQDWNEAERIGTHLILGATMAGLGARSAVKGAPIEGGTDYAGFHQAGKAFSKLKGQSVNLDNLTESMTGLHDSIRKDLILHRESLRNDGARTIQDAITADKQQLSNTNQGTIPTAGIVGEVSGALAKTGYLMKPAEQSLLKQLINQPFITLEQAKNLRTMIGRATYDRGKIVPEAKMALTAAYDGLGEGMKDRITELQGTSRPYEHYNNQFKVSFELNKGIAGQMMKSIQGQDRHAAIEPLTDFSKANISEIQEQMRTIGLNEQADRLGQSKQYAKTLTGTYRGASGNYLQGIYRLFMMNPKEAWPGLVTMAALHGMSVPFPGPQIIGSIVGKEYMQRRAMSKSAAIGEELRSTLPPESFRTRTQAETPETFQYQNPDEGWPTTKSGAAGKQ